MPPKFAEIVALWQSLWSRETLTLSAPLPERDDDPAHPSGLRLLLEGEDLPSISSPADPAPRRDPTHWLLAGETLAAIPPRPGPSARSFGLRQIFTRESLPPPRPPGDGGSPPRSILRWVLAPEKLIAPPPTPGDHQSSPPE